MSARPRLAVLAVLAAGGTAFGGYYLWPSGRHIASCALKHAPVPPAAQKALAAYTNRIRYEVSRDADGSRESDWYDVRTGRDLEGRSAPTGLPQMLTYLTLRTRVTEHGKVLVTDVAWLPLTSVNLADMELRIPNGFEREPVQHGSGVGFAVLTTTATSARCA